MSIAKLFSDPDFQLNLVAETIGVTAEVIIISVIFAMYIRYRKSKKWRPARLNVAKRLIEAHKTIFNASRRIVDVDFHAVKEHHGIPKHVPQLEADYWAKSVFKPQFETELAQLKMLTELNNSALDEELLPQISNFLVAAQVVADTSVFLLECYNPKSNVKQNTTAPFTELKIMEASFNKVLSAFPELTDYESHWPYEVLSAQQMIEVFKKAQEKNPKMNLLTKPELHDIYAS